MITVKSNFDKGTVSIHFKHHDSASLSFGVTGDALKVKSIKRKDEDDVFSSEDESDEVSEKISEEENEKPPPPPTLFVLSIVNDGAKFREKFTKPGDDDENKSVKYLVAV